jgi:hypothetical protein
VAKISATQLEILQGMREKTTLHSHVVKGNASPLYPTRSAWRQNYETSINPGMKSILLSTLDALLREGMIEESDRYRSGTPVQGTYAWEVWTVNYRLTDKGRKIAMEASSTLARLIRTGGQVT